MTTEQYYLTKLTEECVEVAQIALKTQQFGMDEAMPGQPFSNKQRCHQEIDDLMAIIEVLNSDHGFGYVQNREAIEAKKIKVLKYLTYSQELGFVDSEPSTQSAKGEQTTQAHVKALKDALYEAWSMTFKGSHKMFSEYFDSLMFVCRDMVLNPTQSVPSVGSVPSVVTDLLSDIQWNATDEYSGDAQCPECLNSKRDGHAEDCRLNALLTSRTERGSDTGVLG